MVTDSLAFPVTPGTETLVETLRALHAASPGLIIALTGSVASGKSTLAKHLQAGLSDQLSVETVSTDGFLFPTQYLRDKGLFQRKGFPETYDRTAMRTAIASVRDRPTDFPGYSHITFDPDPALTRRIAPQDILLMEGLGFEPGARAERTSHQPDILVYLDAELEDLETWFLERFVRFWEAAEHDPTSFYAQFRSMSQPELIEFAKSVWAGINLPNLENHILPMRDHADLIVRKQANHAVSISTDRT